MIEWDIILLVGILFVFSTYLILQVRLTQVVIGFAMLTNAANLLILSKSGNPTNKTVPIISPENQNMVDPLPQALILTAIVIGFALTAYLTVLIYRLYLSENTEYSLSMFVKEKEKIE